MLALIVMGVVLYVAMGNSADWLALGLVKRLTYLTALVLLGAVVYFATLYLIGFRPRDYIRRVSR
jgi:putative peptidoglycan lipid II flippase